MVKQVMKIRTRTMMRRINACYRSSHALFDLTEGEQQASSSKQQQAASSTKHEQATASTSKQQQA